MARALWSILACVLLRPLAAAQPQSHIVVLSTQAPDQDGVSVSHPDESRLAALSADLKLGPWNARIHAVHELEPYGSTGLPLLEYAARDADWQVRLTAVHFLGRLGRPALRSLAEVLKEEPCRHVRITAIHWLGNMGPAASGVLAEALGDESGMARLTGRYWLRKLGQDDYSASAEGLDSQAAQREDLKVCRPSLQPGRIDLAKRLEAQPPPAPPAELAELELPPTAPAAAGLAGTPAPEAARSEEPLAKERELELDKLLADSPPEDLPPAPAPLRRQGGTTTQSPAMAQASLRRGEPDLSLGAPTKASEAMPPGPPGADVSAPEKPSISAAGSGTRPEPRPGIAPPAGAPESFPKSPPGAVPSGTPAPEVALAQDHGQPKPENDPLPELIRALRQGDALARARAADEAGKRGAKAAAAMPALLEDLKHPDRRVRASAALALGNIGKAADSAVPALVSALKDPSEDVQWSAAVALGRLGTPRARRAFRRYLRDQAGILARPQHTD